MIFRLTSNAVVFRGLVFHLSINEVKYDSFKNDCVVGSHTFDIRKKVGRIISATEGLPFEDLCSLIATVLI